MNTVTQQDDATPWATGAPGAHRPPPSATPAAGTVRAVLITATEPEPRSFGKQVVLGGILDHLLERLGPSDVHVVVLGGDPGSFVPTRWQRHVVPVPGPLGQVGAVLTRVVLPPHTSLQEAALHSPATARRLAEVLAGIAADLEVWDTLRTAQYVPGAVGREVTDGWGTTRRVRRVLYADDLFSERYASMNAVPGGVASGAGPLGEFARFLPGAVGRLLAHPRVHRPLLSLERRLVHRREGSMTSGFLRTLLVNEREVVALRRRDPGADVQELPPSLPHHSGTVRSWDGAPEVVFLGSLSFAPNLDGLEWFLENCREAVLDAVPGFRLTVVGRGGPGDLPSAARWGDRVRFTGWVDDLDGLLGSAAAMLSPLRFGSGTKIKVLEALARGLPVVATPAGVHGVPAGPDHGSLVRSGADGLAAALAEVVEPARNRDLSLAAVRTWDSTYAPAVVRSRYDRLLLDVVPGPAGEAPGE